MFSLLYQDDHIELNKPIVLNDVVKEASKYIENVPIHIHTYFIDADNNEREELSLLRTLPSSFDSDIESECVNTECRKQPLFLTKFTKVSDVIKYIIGDKKSGDDGDTEFVVKIRYRSKETMIPIHKSNLQCVRLADLPRENSCGYGSCVDLHVYFYNSDCIVDDD